MPANLCSAPYLVNHLLEESAARTPATACLVHNDKTTSYGALDQCANRIAQLLREHGVRRGDRVAILAYNSRFYAECYFGALKAGCVAVPVNTAATAKTLLHILRDCGARALAMGLGTNRPVAGALAEMPELGLLLSEGKPRLRPETLAGRDVIDTTALEGCPEAPDVGAIDQDLAAIIYTSGSTGKPRGAMLSHLNCVSNALSVLRYLQLTAEDRVFHILPFYYIYGQSVLLTHLAVGATVVIEDGLLYPQRAVDNLEASECTGFSGVPSSFAILLNRTDFAERTLPHLRYVTQAGGAMSPALIRRVIDTLPGKRVFIMYGATEAAGRLSYVPADRLQDWVGSIGQPIDNVELRVLRPDGSEADVAETGEIVARGSCIMQGYWNDPDETASVLDGHGYHTGDLGHRSAEGFLTVVGRSREMIKTGAHRVSPKEIEEAMLEHEAVHEAAVIGAPDELLGEAVWAYYVPKAEAVDADELKKFLSARLPQYKIPARIEARKDLPKNESGKIMKRALRQDADEA
jgi:acyl-CoA synthetase (AMP-forming)/AMP-acid ligase II